MKFLGKVNFVKFLVTIIILIVVCFMMTGCASVCIVERTYEYTDTFGNKGVSNNCYKRSNSGGLYCDIDGGVVQVVQYITIEENEVCN